jgi:hypothetical protein
MDVVRWLDSWATGIIAGEQAAHTLTRTTSAYAVFRPNRHYSGANTHFTTKQRNTVVWFYIENWSLDNWLRLENSGSSVALQYNITFLAYFSLKLKYL